MARKSNFESKPVVSAGSSSTSSAKKSKRSTARTAAHHKSSSVEAAELPVALDGAATEKTASPEVLASSIANLSEAVAPAADREAVARLAYYFWEQRGYQGGSQEDDWLRAERELLNQRSLIGPQ